MASINVRKPICRTTFIIIFLCALLAGLFIAKFTEPMSGAWLLVPLVLLPFTVKKGPILVAYLLLTGLLFGWWRGGILQTENLKLQNYFGRTITLTARATEDSFYADKSQLEFTAESMIIDGQKMPGKVRVRGYGEAMVYRHDVVAVHGKLYPARGGKQVSVSYADIDVIARAQSSLEDFRRHFIAGMETALPEPAASFGVGLLVGQRSLLPTDTATMLVAVGLTHVVAVSGYNLTIIIQAVTRGLKRLSRFQIVSVSLALIYLFLLITGYSPSIIRAAIVATLGLLAWYFGRRFRPPLLITIAAAITGFMNPYYVWGDIGWYLSFLAFFGVLILAPLLSARLFKAKKVPLIGSIAIESFAAQIMTLPLIMFIFGRISVVGFLANIIVVPMVPLAMLFALISGLAGMFAPVISGWFALPARVLLDVMLWVAHWFSTWPHATTQTSITAAGFLSLYAIIAVAILGLKKHFVSVTIEQRRTNVNEV